MPIRKPPPLYYPKKKRKVSRHLETLKGALIISIFLVASLLNIKNAKASTSYDPKVDSISGSLTFGWNNTPSRQSVCQSFIATHTNFAAVVFPIRRNYDPTVPTNYSHPRLKIYSGNACNSSTTLIGSLDPWSNTQTDLDSFKNAFPLNSFSNYVWNLPLTLTIGQTYSYRLEVTSFNFQDPFDIAYDVTAPYTDGNASAKTSVNDFLPIVGDLSFSTISTNPDAVILDYAVQATQDGVQTIRATGHTINMAPTSISISAVRIDALSPHHFWTAQPVSAGNTIDTANFQAQQMENGTWRVRALATDGIQVISSNYTDVVLSDSANRAILTVTNLPIGSYNAATDTFTVIQTVDTGYTFSASAASIIGAGGLAIDRTGCAHIPTEDATSTLCQSSTWLQQLQNYPLISWPSGIAFAAWNAYTESATGAALLVQLQASTNGWTPAMTFLDSSSTTAGVPGSFGINPIKYKPILELFIYGSWVMALYSRAKSIIA